MSLTGWLMEFGGRGGATVFCGEAGLEGMVAGEEWFKACLALSSDVSVDRLREWFGGQSYVRGGGFCCPCLLCKTRRLYVSFLRTSPLIWCMRDGTKRRSAVNRCTTCLFYWYTSTNTEAEDAARCREQAQHSRKQGEGGREREIASERSLIVGSRVDRGLVIAMTCFSSALAVASSERSEPTEV
jgi:hypothetical protein